MSRELTSHKVNGCNEALVVRAMDEPGHGGASHEYRIEWGHNGEACNAIDIRFQNGPIAEVGTNGITHEALLAILIDRFEGFQAGAYACEENAVALSNLRGAQRMLKHRTEKRLARGVEGTHTV